MTKAICIRKENGDKFEIDMTIARNEAMLSAFLQSPLWECYDENGNELKAPEIETHPVQLECLHFSGFKCTGWS